MGKLQVDKPVLLIGRGLIGVDAESGKMLWSYNRVASDIANISTPVVQGDQVFSSSGYGTGAGLVRIRKGEGEWTAEEIYFLEADTMQNHHGGMILHDGYVYRGTGHNKGFPLAVEMDSGAVAARSPAPAWASRVTSSIFSVSGSGPFFLRFITFLACCRIPESAE